MPEGPEIRIAADRLAKALVGEVTTKVFFAFPHLKRYQQQLAGKTITAIETKGKAIVTLFDNGMATFSHNQLYGRWYISDAGEAISTQRQLRLAFHNEKKSAWLYSASTIEVMHQELLPAHPFLKKLGPDLLSDRPSAKQIAARLKQMPFAKRSLASLLLDQSFVAGLGNYLRSEILGYAHLHPKLRPVDCNEQQLRELAEFIIRITQQSYKTKGITNIAERVKALKANGVKRRDYRHILYGRDGAPCYECGDTIRREDIASRRIYICPTCQSL